MPHSITRLSGTLKELRDQVVITHDLTQVKEIEIKFDEPTLVNDLFWHGNWRNYISANLHLCPLLEKITLTRMGAETFLGKNEIQFITDFFNFDKAENTFKAQLRTLKQIDMSSYNFITLMPNLFQKDPIKPFFDTHPTSPLQIVVSDIDYERLDRGSELFKRAISKTSSSQNSFSAGNVKVVELGPDGQELNEHGQVLQADDVNGKGKGKSWEFPAPLRAIGRFLDGLGGAVVGLVLGVATSLVIYNPITVFLAALSLRRWVSRSPIQNILFLILGPIFLPIVLPFVNIFLGAYFGFRKGTFKAFTIPTDVLKFAKKVFWISKANIFTPWIILGLLALAVGIIFGLVALGAIAMPAFIPAAIVFVTTGAIWGALFTLNTLLWAGVGLLSFATIYTFC